MMNASLRQLRYFVILAETLNFSRAAAKAGITQSTLSSAIQGLEEEIGTKLLDRSGRSVAMTLAGEAVLPRIRKILGDVDDLPGLAAEVGRPLSNRLRLGIIPSIAPFLLPRALPSLRQAFPELRLTIREGLTRQLLAELRSGELDTAVIALPYVLDGIEFTAIGEDPFMLALAQINPLSARNDIVPDDLQRERILLLDEGHCLREHVLAALETTGAVEPEEIRATSLTTLVQMVDNNMGVTLLPRLALEAGVARGTNIVLKSFNRPRAVRQLALVWREKSSRRAELQMLAGHLQGQLSFAPSPARKEGPASTARVGLA